MKCKICSNEMTEHEGPRKDCGGDCMSCMARSGDPGAELFMSGYYKIALKEASREFSQRGLYGDRLLAAWSDRKLVGAQ